MDKLQAMRWYVRVCETGSFTAAANIFGVSTASVSRAVGFLEDEIQTRLLQRNTRRQSMTEVDAQYLESCKEIIHKVDAATALAGSYNGKPAGCLRVHSVTEFGLECLLPLIAEFTEQNPDVSIDLTLSRQKPHLIDEGLDVLITTSSKLPDSDLVARHIGSFSSVICAAPAYLDAAGVPLSPLDLEKHRCIGLTDALYPTGWQFEMGGRELNILVPTTLRANLSEAVLKLSVMGMGICLIPEFVAAPALASGALVRVLPLHKIHARNLYAIYSPRRYPDPKIRAWIDHLKHGLPSVMLELAKTVESAEFWVGRKTPGLRQLAPSPARKSVCDI